MHYSAFKWRTKFQRAICEPDQRVPCGISQATEMSHRLRLFYLTHLLFPIRYIDSQLLPRCKVFQTNVIILNFLLQTMTEVLLSLFINWVLGNVGRNIKTSPLGKWSAQRYFHYSLSDSKLILVSVAACCISCSCK